MDMMSLRRRIMGAEKTLLPSAYQQVEYLESTGTQWIKTDIESRFSVTVESDIMFTASQDSYTFSFLDGEGFRIGANGWWNYRMQIGYGSTYRSSGANTLPLNIKYKYKSIIEDGNQEVYLDDELKTTFNMTRNTDTLTGTHFGIFARCKNDTGADLFSKAKMYSLKVSDAGVLLGDYIPCYRKADQKPGMYDLVSGTFYTNSGTGEFVVGEEV